MKIKRVIVGTESESKLAAVKQALAQMFPSQIIKVIGVRVDSAVPNQPFGLPQICEGASNRAHAALALDDQAQLAIGLEGGVCEVGSRLINIGMVFIVDKSGNVGLGTSEGIVLPKDVERLVRQGLELSDAMQEVYNIDTVKTRDCSGYLTMGRLPSDKYYLAPAISALLDYTGQVQ